MVRLDHLEVRIAIERQAVQGLEVIDREQNGEPELRVTTSESRIEAAITYFVCCASSNINAVNTAGAWLWYSRPTLMRSMREDGLWMARSSKG